MALRVPGPQQGDQAQDPRPGPGSSSKGEKERGRALAAHAATNIFLRLVMLAVAKRRFFICACELVHAGADASSSFPKYLLVIQLLPHLLRSFEHMGPVGSMM